MWAVPCCEENISSCLACKEGQTEKEFCMEPSNQDISGCESFAPAGRYPFTIWKAFAVWLEKSENKKTFHL